MEESFILKEVVFGNRTIIHNKEKEIPLKEHGAGYIGDYECISYERENPDILVALKKMEKIDAEDLPKPISIINHA